MLLTVINILLVCWLAGIVIKVVCGMQGMHQTSLETRQQKLMLKQMRDSLEMQKQFQALQAQQAAQAAAPAGMNAQPGEQRQEAAQAKGNPAEKDFLYDL